jgi:molybdopterin/thiamine biosynthesis adenylyltransferase/rhodanese-related sulfurtransferase
MSQEPTYQPRYQRQLILRGWGPAAQRKLGQARILVVGAGGLGCPALQYLAAAGTGVLGIVDDDKVSLTDLHRQILYTAEDTGALKVEKAAAFLNRLNPDVRVITHPVRLTSRNALEILKDYDLVLDASDNFGTRYLVGDACVLLGKPLVYGSISRFEGQVAVFNGSASYRDLFPEPPEPGEVLSCAEAGVLGVLAGIIGSMQALEAMKVVTGVGMPLRDRLLTYQSLQNSFYEIAITPSGKRGGPADAEAFAFWPYGDGCGDAGPRAAGVVATATDTVGRADAKVEPAAPPFTTIDLAAFEVFLARADVLIIDVRETGEEPIIDHFKHLSLPLSRLREKDPEYTGQTIVVFCQSGKRSGEAAGILAAHNIVYQLEHGILEWLAAHSE